MDIYILDDGYARRQLIDRYESFIWTERYSAFGDFELVVPSTATMRSILQEGVYLSIHQSNRLMKVEVIDDSVDQEGRKTLTVTGRSLEARLEDRIAISPGTTGYPWKWSFDRYTPSVGARNLYREICYANINNAKEHFTDTGIDEAPKPNRIPEPAETIKVEFEPKPLYAAIKDICDPYDLGFGIFVDDLRNMHRISRPLTFRVYTGYDRTTGQTVNAPVVFAPDLDNLENTTALTTSAGVKNVALVTSKRMRVEVFGNGADSNVAGRDRRVVLVKADNVEEGLTVGQETAYLTQLGKEELAKHRRIEAFDGEISQYNRYLYGRDYGLGDVVELRNTDGSTNKMLVTEQIFVSDAEGERSYPTLTLYMYIEKGSWLAWGNNRNWDELTTEEWRTLP